MDLMQFAVENLNKLDIGDSNSVIIFLSISFLIGIISLTWRYVLSYKNTKEHKKWNEENITNKIILFFLVGISSYILVLTFRILMQRVNTLVIQPQIFNFTWIILAITYSIVVLSSESKHDYLKIIKEFLRLTWSLTILFFGLWVILLNISSNLWKWIVFIIGMIIITIRAGKESGWKLFGYKRNSKAP